VKPPSAEALRLIKLLLKDWKESNNPERGVALRDAHPGLAECLEHGWVYKRKNAPGMYRINDPGALELLIEQRTGKRPTE